MVYPYTLNKCLQHVALFKCRDILVLFLFLYFFYFNLCYFTFPYWQQTLYFHKTKL